MVRAVFLSDHFSLSIGSAPIILARALTLLTQSGKENRECVNNIDAYFKVNEQDFFPYFVRKRVNTVNAVLKRKTRALSMPFTTKIIFGLL